MVCAGMAAEAGSSGGTSADEMSVCARLNKSYCDVTADGGLGLLARSNA